MRKTVVACDVCGEVFKMEPFPGVQDKARTRLVGNVVIGIQAWGDRTFTAHDKLSIEVCADEKKPCRHKAIDHLIKIIEESERASVEAETS